MLSYMIGRMSHLNAMLLRQIAVEANADPRTVKRYLDNQPDRPVRPTAHQRITYALIDRGLSTYVRHPVSETSLPKSRA